MQLSAVHLLIADLDEGRVPTLGCGNRAPERGPVAGVLNWAASVGSRAWCAGLGRLLQRAAEHWQADGSLSRARLGYLAALPLLAADPALPTRSVVTALAGLESRTGLTDEALIRLERLGHAPGGPPEFVAAHQLEAALGMVDAHRRRIDSADAEHAARGLLRLRGRLDELLPRLRDPHPAIQALATIDVLVPLARCGHANRRGMPEQAEQWYRVALEAAERPGAPADLRPLVLVAGERRAEACTALTELDRDRVLPGEVLAPLALRAGDFALAGRAFTRSGGPARARWDWPEALTAAEIALAHGDAAAAFGYAGTGVGLVEEYAGTLLRDADRAAVHHRAVGLYLVAAKALAILAHAEHHRPDAADLRRRSLAAAERWLAPAARPEPDHAGSGAMGIPALADAWQQWRQCTADRTAHAGRLLAAIDTPGAGDAGPLLQIVDTADAALTRAECEVERVSPGALLRRAAPPEPLDVRLLQSRLAADTVVLEYLTAGSELLLWAVTRDDVLVHHSRVSERHLAALVRRFHSRCAAGHAPGPEATELSALLLTDVAAVLRRHRRVVVVPSGPLRLVPVHALPFEDRPLGMDRVVSYAPSLTPLADCTTALDQPVVPAKPLIVADPAAERSQRPGLRPLPGARVEARAAAAILGCGPDEVLVDEAATRSAIRERSPGRDVLLFATHTSAFPSGDGVLSGAELAVLSGGDTGRTTVTLGDDVAGLTRAMSRAGIRQVVLPLWPVDDAVAPVVICRFLRGLADGAPPAYALAEAQRFVARAGADRLRAEYVALGGVPGPVVLRGVKPRDDEFAEPLGGDAERHWAPFVLIGL